MKNNTKQIQKSGNDSINVQAQIMTVNKGMSYSEVKSIAIDVFNANFYELSKQAHETAVQRAVEVTNNLINQLKQNRLLITRHIQDPGFQYALFEAQKSYAKNGNVEMAKTLVNLLLSRLEYKNNTIEQIIIDESLRAVTKLTNAQIDILSIIFITNHFNEFRPRTKVDLSNYLEKFLKPFINNLNINKSTYLHLELVGVCSTASRSKPILDWINELYEGDLKKEFIFSKKELQQIESGAGIMGKIFLEERILTNHLKKFKKSVFIPLFEAWEESLIKQMSLTSIGIVLAQANLEKKVGIKLNLTQYLN